MCKGPEERRGLHNEEGEPAYGQNVVWGELYKIRLKMKIRKRQQSLSVIFCGHWTSSCR